MQHETSSASDTHPSQTNLYQRQHRRAYRRMSGVANSIATTPADIQMHIYQAFLEGRTADVSLHIRGSWEGIYRLHRVVLIQAGFFRSLFDGGFREAVFSSSAPGEVDITFDDPNISRAAFEICIARLYGGGPTLFLDPLLLPSRKDPLTPSFPKHSPPTKTPEGAHPATPRFLLSLLATATYLAIPSLVSQALSLVLNSVGPRTVIRYLNFAIGKGIGDKEYGEPEAAIGLEDVCVAPKEKVANSSRSMRSTVSLKTVSIQDDALHDDNYSIVKEDPSSVHTPDDEYSHEEDIKLALGSSTPHFQYGPVSDRIGQATATWLTRWGADMLAYEEAVELPPTSQRSGLSRRRATESHAEPPSLSGLSRDDVPIVWRRGGLDAIWARTILSSDAFFVKSERDRYDIARRVVELRRKDSLDLEEEREWEQLFTHGIHYMHMSMEDLIDISEDISPTTKKAYASLAALQSAHWSQSLLRQQIVRSGSPSSHSPASPKERELGLAITTPELLASANSFSSAGGGSTLYYPVPVDSSAKIGGIAALEGATMEELFEQSNKSGKKSGIGARTSEANFFGIQSTGRTASACVQEDASGTARWSRFPPVRFGVEFWGVDNLHEKARLHSHTIWYAGSLFNVYVQVVRKKGFQLGVYLHRQSTVDPVPLPSPPPFAHIERPPRVNVDPPPIPTSVSTPSLHRQPSRGGMSVVSRSTTPTSAPATGSSISSSSFSSSSPITYGIAPAQPFRDPRSSILAYFTIYCASPTGSSLTRFSSAPDVFSVSQSWGWKSSTSQTEEFIDPNESESVPSMSKIVSLRATVLVGIV